MASADLLRREEEFYESLFDSAKGDAAAAKTRGQMIERKIEALEDMATKWLNDRLLIELVPRLHVEEIKGLFAPPPFGEEAPLSAFCRTSVGEWDAFRSIDMDVEARFMQRMKQSSKQKNLVNEDESIVLNVIFLVVVIMLRTCVVSRLGSKNKMERIRAFIEDTTDKDVLVLNVQDPFQRLLLHGVCEFYNVTSTTTGTVQDGKPWKTTTIKKRSGTGVAPMITLVSFLRTKKNGSHVVS
ncbi:hypothetical protein CFC21_070845 [Triticum aestivum]|uniref:R3H-associated N-terminal domain-containing protein n=2 Tax=Triticum aestivum TaxID=4565 RepID=A0A9R1HGB0_WHEAT|nr:hypothetical protein CFC21_070845 [Triticum aestivum]